MGISSRLLPDTRKKLNVLLYALMAAEGLFALAALFRIRSETGSSFLFGYSLSRLALAGGVVLAMIGLPFLLPPPPSSQNGGNASAARPGGFYRHRAGDIA